MDREFSLILYSVAPSEWRTAYYDTPMELLVFAAIEKVKQNCYDQAGMN